jgi:hypothetical protein
MLTAVHAGPASSGPTPAGFVFEFEERWNDEGQEWYAREMMRAEVAGGQIAELTVYGSCHSGTGRLAVIP